VSLIFENQASFPANSHTVNKLLEKSK